MPVIIKEIIKKQTISILDAVLQAQSQQNTDSNQSAIQKDKAFTPQQYASIYLTKSVIKEDQKQIIAALIEQYLQSQNQNNQFKNQPLTFTFDDAYSILKSIKRDLLKETPTKKTQKINDTQIIQSKSGLKRNQTPLKNSIDNQTSINQNDLESGPKNTHRSRHNQSEQDQTDKELGQMSKKLKKQSQFIARNIDRIKKYATNFSEAILPLERSQLQQVKISHQISHKLFHLYKPIYPSGMSNNKQVEMNNFETKEHYKSTLNYHKILEMFIDAPIKLEIQNKLSLLRIIKKFSFNPNFIQLQEWTKIYRAIINNLGFKQILLQRLVKTKEQEKKHNKLPSIVMASKQKPQKAEYRSRRIKTQVSIPEHRLTSLNNIDNFTNQYQSQRNIQYMSNKSSIRPIEQQQKNQPKSYNPNEYRSRHKKLLTDVSQVFLKNVKKDLRSEKMIGLEDNNQDKNGSQVLHEPGKNQYSYLKKAIKSKKIGKITWESLFDMNEDTMYHNIVIPEFARLLDQESN